MLENYFKRKRKRAALPRQICLGRIERLLSENSLINQAGGKEKEMVAIALAQLRSPSRKQLRADA